MAAKDFWKVIVQKPNQKPVVLSGVDARGFTVGKDIACSYTLDVPMLSERHRLFRRRSGRGFLMVPLGVDCELASRTSEKKISLSGLVGLGLVEQVNGSYAVPFQSGCAAVLRMGETTMGVEYVSSTARTRAENLPWSLRVRPLSKSDLVFIAILAVTFVSSFFSAYQLHTMTISPREEVEEMQLHYAKLILETPVVTKDLFLEEKLEKQQPKEPEKKPADQAESAPEPTENKKPPAKRPDSGGEDIRGKGLLGHLQRTGGSKGILASKELTNALSGVGVLTTKRPAGQRVSGPRFSYREASGVDDIVAGIASRSVGVGDGRGGGKATAAVANPFDVSGSGSRHQLRSYEEIDRVIRRHLEGIRYLYERYLRTNPSLQGRISLRFTIGPDGAVKNCSLVTSSMGLEAFHQELIRRVYLWQFPAIEKGSGSVSVVYPFTFLPKRTN